MTEQSNPRILIVDDNRSFQKVISKFLEKAGLNNYEVVSSAEEALRALNSEEFDLLSVDWQLPDLDGLELLRLIRMRFATLPIVVVTGNNQEQQVREAKSAGASGYVIKPFSQKTFLRTITNFLSKKTPPQRP